MSLATNIFLSNLHIRAGTAYSQRMLNDHLAIKHSSEKVHKCKECNELFRHSADLSVHRRKVGITSHALTTFPWQSSLALSFSLTFLSQWGPEVISVHNSRCTRLKVRNMAKATSNAVPIVRLRRSGDQSSFFIVMK